MVPQKSAAPVGNDQVDGRFQLVENLKNGGLWRRIFPGFPPTKKGVKNKTSFKSQTKVTPDLFHGSMFKFYINSWGVQKRKAVGFSNDSLLQSLPSNLHIANGTSSEPSWKTSFLSAKHVVRFARGAWKKVANNSS